MLRKQVANEKKRQKDPIKWRGHEITRIEAFSDAVFAFAVTLLIVALEVPENYHELMEHMAMFIPFGICFLLLFAIWGTQNMFFRRYGLHDSPTLALNGMLLFMTLLFMYPLKFLAVAISHQLRMQMSEFRSLWCIYAGGFSVIYLLFVLMYRHAYNRRDLLKLDEQEAFETRTQMFVYLGIASGGILALVIGCTPGISPNYGALGFGFIWPVVSIINKTRAKEYARRFHSDMKHDEEQAKLNAELKTIDNER